MTNVTIAAGKLVIEIEGWDKLWSFQSRIEIPLEHVVNAHPGNHEHVAGLRAPGTSLPGIITAGTFHPVGGAEFWDVHDPAKAIAIELRDDRYAKLVVEVADPEASIELIRDALGSGPFSSLDNNS